MQNDFNFMIMKKKIMIALGVGSLLVAALAYQFMTPKAAIDIAKAKAAYEMQASKLYAAFEADETAANAQYANTIMTINGTITKTEKNENGQMLVSLEADSPLGAVVCTLQDKSITGNQLRTGSPITVKGICTGYLFDVVIDRAILVN